MNRIGNPDSHCWHGCSNDRRPGGSASAGGRRSYGISSYIYLEAQLAVHSFLLGVILMISYDLLRLFRLLIPHSLLIIGLEDFVYWIYCAVMTFWLLFQENNGALRSYVIVGVFVGMILYDRIVSRPIFSVLKKIKRWFTIKVKRFTIKVRDRRRKKKVRSHGTEP